MRDLYAERADGKLRTGQDVDRHENDDRPVPHIFFVVASILLLTLFVLAWMVVRITLQVSPPYDPLAAHWAVMPGQSDAIPATYDCAPEPATLIDDLRYCSVEDHSIRRIVISSADQTIQRVTFYLNDLPFVYLLWLWGEPKSIAYDYWHDDMFFTATWGPHARARGPVLSTVTGNSAVQILWMGAEAAQKPKTEVALEVVN